jgi:hypothetical protein
MSSPIITKEYYRRIPYFDGNPSELILFTNKLESLLNIFCQDDNTHRLNNNLIILEEAQLKLQGKARQCLYEKRFTTTLELVNYLKSHFKDSRTAEQLKFNLYNTKLRLNENPLDFLNRIQEQRILIIARIRIDGGNDEEVEIRIAEKEIARYVLSQLPPRIQDSFRHMIVTDLNTIINSLSNENSDLIEQLYTSKRNEYRQNERPKYENQKQRNNYNQNYNKQNYYNQHKPMYNQRPYYYTPRQNEHQNWQQYKPHYNTQNSQQYKNVWKSQPVHLTPANAKKESQNTVSMRTAQPINHVQQEDSTQPVNYVRREELDNLSKNIETLHEKFDYFLDVGSSKDRPPPRN